MIYDLRDINHQSIFLKRKIEISLGRKIEYSELTNTQLEHQMSSSSSYSSASSRASNAYNKSVLPFCKVCYDAGMPVADYTDHFVKDQPGPNGKVVCPTLLAQKCLNCGVPGHTTNYCPEKLHGERDRSERDREERERAKKSVAAGQSWETVGQKSASSSSSIKPRPRIEDMDANTKAKTEKMKEYAPASAPRKTYGGSFGVLCIDDLSSDDECEQAEMRNTPAGAPKPVHTQRPILTGPPSAVEPTKPLTWAQRAAAQKASTPYSSAPRPAAAHLTDTRFQLHALCERVEMDKRAIAAPKRAAAAAVAIATENSRKRKQESAMVPA
jgi:hypothetical protein